MKSYSFRKSSRKFIVIILKFLHVKSAKGAQRKIMMIFYIDWDYGLSLMLKIKSYQAQILSLNVRADDGRDESESDTGFCPLQQTMNCTNCG